MVDEGAQLSQPAVLIRYMLIQTKLSGHIALLRIMVKCLNQTGMLLHCLMRAGKPFLYQLIGLMSQRSRHLVQIKLRMVLDTPEHSSLMPDLDRLNLRNRIARQECGIIGQGFDLIRVNARASKAADRPTSRPGSNPASAGVIRRANPASRPLRLGRTEPPEATAATCKPAQDSKVGVPDASANA
jgi:hypothetical protein